MLNAATRKTVLVRGKEKPLLVKYKPKNKAYSAAYHRPGARLHSEEQMYGHDLAVVNTFVLLAASGKLEAFQRYWDDEQRKYYGDQFGLWPDAVFALNTIPDHMFFLEIDFGTEWNKGQIPEKLQAYDAFARAHPDQRFTVLFPTQGAYDEPDDRRVEKLLTAFASMRRRNMFLVTTLKQFTGDPRELDGDPLAPIFRSPLPVPHNPLDPNAISILDVT